MKFLALLFLSLTLSTGTSFAETKTSKDSKPQETAKMAVKTHPQDKCPIRGETIDKKVFTDHNGKRIYFCCPLCMPEFKKDPEKYIKKLEAEGVVFDKTPKS